MAQADEELTVAQRLGHLLDRGLLPAGGPAEAAERLIERLERPARVALLGLPGSGKSTILNMLTGSVIVPETLRLPTIIVQHGTDERMICTLAEGKTQIVPGRDLSDVLKFNPALVTLEADLPSLKVISLLEVSAGPMDAEQRRAAIWASKRADILIWCTTSYLPKEQQVWESMTDAVKDNGFLFLTKIDLLGGREAAQGMLERVEQRAGEEFRQVLSISAKQARAAMPAGSPVDRDLFRDSGAAAVIMTIKSRVQMARRADTDMAELLLARHVEAGGIVARRFAEQDESIRREAAPQWNPPPEVEAEPAPVAVMQPVAEVHQEPAPEPVQTLPPERVARPDPEEHLEPYEQPKPATGVVLEPEPAVAPEGPAALPVETEPAPEVERRPEPERDITSSGGRKRFADRIKQMPMSDDVSAQPLVPLRSTWKSKSETAAAAASTPRVQPAPPPAIPAPLARAEPAVERAVDPVAIPEPVTAVPRQPLAEALRPRAGVEDPGPDPEEDIEDVAPDAAEQDDPEERADQLPRVERLMPTDNMPPVERSARTQLFGSRKPAAALPAAAMAGARQARTGEPVTRVRATAMRTPEPPRPEMPLPEMLASPRFAGKGEQPNEGSSSNSGPQRGDRRERPRIAARAAPVVPVAAIQAAAISPVAGADQGVLGAAIAVIMSRATALAQLVEPSAKVPVDMVLEHCRDTTEQVMEIVSRVRSSDLQRIRVDLGQVQDLIMLMLLEKGHAPADDALTLLLQIRRDLETLRGV